MTVSEALNKYGSDKVKGWPYGHNYAYFYDELFSKFNDPINLLEIGVLRGESLRAWREVLPKSLITGIDIIDISLPEHLNIKLIKSDVKDIKLDGKYDIIIDDSSHDLRESLYEIKNFCNNLSDNGVMIIEDIQIPDLYIKEMLKVLPKGFILESHDFRHLSENKKHDDFIVKIMRQ